MRNIHCLFCQGDEELMVLYESNLNHINLDNKIFSARRLPDGCHYRIIRCKKCGLIYSNPILGKEKIKKLYTKSKFTYETEVDNLRKTYGYYLEKIGHFVLQKEKVLEIGCGNGFFLEEAREQGYKEVWGVEPSVEAVGKALPKIKRKIIVDFFRSGLFKKNFFDLICFFQTLDHIIDPNLFLKTCYEILKKDGIIFCVVHNTDFFLNKLFGQKSPIFDIEHIYLFGKNSLKKLFEKNKFLVADQFEIVNQYSIAYWVKISPLRLQFKNVLLKTGDFLGISQKAIKLNVGNIAIIAKKYKKLNKKYTFI